MIIGTVRLEEAKALNSYEGTHPFHNENGDTYGSFIVEWIGTDHPELSPGWYWYPGIPGCLPDGDYTGPFASSGAAHSDADPDG